MDVALWIVSGFLAFMFFMHGVMMLNPTPPATGRMAYIGAVPFRRPIGVLEILGAVGLILPWLLDILPWLTPLAALGMVFIMAGGIVIHSTRQEYANSAFNVVLLGLSAFVAYFRWFD